MEGEPRFSILENEVNDSDTLLYMQKHLVWHLTYTNFFTLYGG